MGLRCTLLQKQLAYQGTQNLRTQRGEFRSASPNVRHQGIFHQDPPNCVQPPLNKSEKENNKPLPTLPSQALGLITCHNIFQSTATLQQVQGLTQQGSSNKAANPASPQGFKPKVRPMQSNQQWTPTLNSNSQTRGPNQSNKNKQRNKSYLVTNKNTPKRI